MNKEHTAENIKAVNDLFEKIAKDNPQISRTSIGTTLSLYQKELVKILGRIDEIEYVLSGPV